MKPASLLFVVLAAASLSAQTGTPKSGGARGVPDRSAADKGAGEKRPVEAAGGDKTIVKSALVTIIEEAEIPAPVEGVLSAVDTREGQLVEARAVVARIEDAEVRLTHERARTEFESSFGTLDTP